MQIMQSCLAQQAAYSAAKITTVAINIT